MSNERVNAFMQGVKDLAEEYPDLNVLAAAVGGAEEIAGMVMMSRERGLPFEDAIMIAQTALGTLAAVATECGAETFSSDLQGFAERLSERSGVSVEKTFVSRQIPN